MNPPPLEIQGKHSSPDNRQVSVYGNNADYLTARIARDRPDILARMQAGEFRSVRAAAIEAGIVKKVDRYSLPDMPEAAARYLAQRVDREWMEAMYRAYLDEN